MEHYVRPDGLPPVAGYSHAVAATGRLVVVSGQVPADGAGMPVGADDPAAQVRQVFENLVAALDKFHVPDREKGELLGALGPLKPQIVVPADKLKPIPDAKLAKVSAIIPSVKDPQAAELLAAAVTAEFGRARSSSKPQ